MRAKSNSGFSLAELMVAVAIAGILGSIAVGGFFAISGYLKRHGFPMLVARNGLEAVQMARSGNPSIILMDIQMPLMDGMEAIRLIRAEESRRTPIIALTALAMRGDRERFLEAGADDYMSKPVRLAELLETITAHLRRDS